MKKCGRCGEFKDKNLYHKDIRKKDGLNSECKTCKKIKNAQWLLDNKDKMKKRDPAYFRNWCKENKSKKDIYTSNYREKYPQKIKARQALNNAVNRGIVLRGNCVICGVEEAHAHHEDYNSPLEVIWLCPAHHIGHHNGTLTKEELCQLKKL